MSRTLRILFLLLVVPLVYPTPGVGQATQSLGSQTGGASLHGVTMERTVTLDEPRLRLGEALDAIAEQAELRLVYGSDVVPVDRLVAVEFEAITVSEAFRRVLAGTGLDFEISRDGQAILMEKPQPAESASNEEEGGAIRGEVTDAETGEGVPAANVWLEGTRWRTVTDSRGAFLFPDVEPGTYTVTAGRIGYTDSRESVTIVEGETVVLDLSIQSAPTQLDAVVATVTGEQRVREMGHVVGRVNADSLVRSAPISSVSELLTGRVPGLQVMQTSGTVGGEVNMRIRSPMSSELGAEPIVIVDGIRYSGGTGYDDESVGGYNVEPTSRLNDLNPNDIESIEVVKGPSAATLYGTDAANGVIVIRTKRGEAGPAQWNAYARAGISEIPDYDFPDTYWGWGTGTANCTLHNMSQGFCQQDSVTVVPNPLNDPDLTIFSPKPRMQYGANVSGGREGFRYYFSVDYEEATGPIALPAEMRDELEEQLGGGKPLESQLEPNRLDKLNLRANVVANLTDKAMVRVDVGYTQSETRQLALGNPYSSSYSARPGEDPYGTGTSGPIGNFSRSSTEWLNRFSGSTTVEYTPVDWLRTRALLGIDMPGTHRYSLGMRDAYENYAGEVGEDRNRALNTTAELGATASFERGRVSSRTSVGAQYFRRYGNRLMMRGRNLRPGGAAVTDAVNITTSQSYREAVTLGGYLEQVIGLDDRLFLTGAARIDGASSFGHDFQAAVYPKASASWVVSEEAFMPEFDWLDDVRLRYAFGASGQQPRPDMRDFEFASRQMLYDGSATNIVSIVRMPSPKLRPERVREHEVGVDLSFLENRLTADLTWSWRSITDQIRAVSLPQGMGTTWTNVGLSTGEGFEALLTARVLDRPEVSLDLTATHATNDSKLKDLGGLPVDYTVNGGMVEGFPLGARFMREIVSYEDENGDGILQLDEVVMSDTAVYVGRGTPGTTQTLSAVAGFLNERVRVSALFDRQADFMQYNSLAMRQRMGGARGAIDPTAPLEEQAKIMATWHMGTTEQPAVGYWELEPGDFTRLREVSLALTLPERWVYAAGLNNAQLSISGRNLFLWSDYSGADPEVGRFNNNFGMMSDNIPNARYWVVRLDVGF